MSLALPSHSVLLAAFIAAMGAGGAARADVIFSNLPTVGNLQPNGYTVEGADAPEYAYYGEQGQDVSPGMQITVGSSDYALTSLTLGLLWENQTYLTGGATASGTNAAVVSLYATGGDTPISQAEGALLGQWSLTGLPGLLTPPSSAPLIARSQSSQAVGSDPFLTEIDGITGITLQANTSYIVEVSPGASDAFLDWTFASSDEDPYYEPSGLILENGAYIGQSYQASLELDGDVVDDSGASDPGSPGGPTPPGDPIDVPEPSSWALLGLGVLVSGIRRTGALLSVLRLRAV